MAAAGSADDEGGIGYRACADGVACAAASGDGAMTDTERRLLLAMCEALEPLVGHPGGVILTELRALVMRESERRMDTEEDALRERAFMEDRRRRSALVP